MVMTPAELEKKNLEVHVELTTLRDKAINVAIEDIEADITDIKESIKESAEDIKEDIKTKLQKITVDIKEIQDDLAKLKDTRNNQIIHTGAVIITLLLGILGALLIRVLIPMFLAK